jgi:hypothetical protein
VGRRDTGADPADAVRGEGPLRVAACSRAVATCLKESKGRLTKQLPELYPYQSTKESGSDNKRGGERGREDEPKRESGAANSAKEKMGVSNHDLKKRWRLGLLERGDEE